MIPRKNRSRMFLRSAGACGILGSTLPLIMILSSTILAKSFSWDSNALSDLGVSEQALLFNSAVILGGLLNIWFAAGLSSYLGKERVFKAGVSSIMASSVCLSLVGIFTTQYLFIHAVVALGYFILAPAGLLLIGSATKGNAIRKVSIACGIAALLTILVLPLLFFALHLRVGFAVPELIESLTVLFWTVFMSAKLVGRTKPAQTLISSE
jgi:hypothetical membrane protein